MKINLNPSTREFVHRGLRVKPIAGYVVQVDCSPWDGQNGSWQALTGLDTRYVIVNEEGTDHFPAAGLYHGSTEHPKKDFEGTSATVHWKLKHEYPLSEDTIASIVRDATTRAGFERTIRLEIPVVYARSWSLLLTAPTPEKAALDYEQLRSGLWKPKTPFTDALTTSRRSTCCLDYSNRTRYKQDQALAAPSVARVHNHYSEIYFIYIIVCCNYINDSLIFG